MDLAAFKRALRKEKPNASNMKYVNKVFRNEVVGNLYAEIHGLRDLIERSGVLSGKYKNEIFNGLIQVMLQKEERLEKGLSLRNFKYSPPWDELCHIIRTYSPAAYRALAEHLPARSERSIRIKEARDPKFPLGITDQVFELVEEHLQQLSYTGPVCVACDDTMLLSAFRLYWDAKEHSHFLIGGVDGPIRVADPDNLRLILEQQETRKASKLRLWTITLSRPRTTPLAIAALPIPNSVSAEVLAEYSLHILRGLIQRNIRVVSYACDGAAVERKAQDIITERGDSRIHYTIENPRQSEEPICLTIPIIGGQPVAMIQDSKHALKTLRNNLFSGARLLVLGSHVAGYSHMRDVAFAPGSPLYRRDVERLDRQDDNAATRLFSADTLKFICNDSDLRDKMLADIIYLFVCGDGIDGFQSRSTSHEERIQSLLRLRFFIDAWLATLSATNYSHRVHTISREALKITTTLIEGYLSLVFIYRDFIRTAEPLMPWLHSTEACEHIFGQARQIVPNFSYADFLHLASKLHVHIRQENLRAEQGIEKSKLPAMGYSHTYFMTGGLDLAKLSVYPTDLQINDVAAIAFDEVDNLLSILGINVRRLRSRYARHPLPSIRSWFPDVGNEDAVNDMDEVGDQEEFDTTHLLSLVTRANDPKRPLLPLKEENAVSSLTSAALALVTQDVLNVCVV
ncbi:hypothetical protein AGABI2DRAFT_66018 [Agaricus bisporus var. bisporus H97]|uniref:hypothetical protein n=1 Tax=Agaricus bisporus var. bisporus (strain H97 / ATCC MYA-4626 / FGSC 10389) TaxID=936046 RepID=UPI00029F6C47|nr:hypothetical protein AGABI2DRAFT_66018 [Agaricus bisporus var. bisporus H97]EKV48918.1 hypothetical protein AGABI2DRAFT_66018 [Agaricus bisporus var. bisporus H97]